MEILKASANNISKLYKLLKSYWQLNGILKSKMLNNVL